MIVAPSGLFSYFFVIVSFQMPVPTFSVVKRIHPSCMYISDDDLSHEPNWIMWCTAYNLVVCCCFDKCDA